MDMKKVLVAGAALMLAGSMVSAASAGTPGDAPKEETGVSISGDARVTYVGWGDYRTNVNDKSTDGYSDYFESRISLNVDAKATGGSFMKSRIYFDNEGYDDDAMWDGYTTEQVSVDYAYFGVPLNDNWKVIAGHMTVDTTTFFSWGGRKSRVKAVYKNNGLKIVPILQINDEFTDNDIDEWSDNDAMSYGLIVAKAFNQDWKAKFFGMYFDDAREMQEVTTTEVQEDGSEVDVTAVVSRTDRSGGIAVVHLDGAVGNVGLAAELGYKSSDVQGTEDDGMGGYVQATVNLGAVNPIFLFGMTQNGFMADNDFGFVMVGGNDSTAKVAKVGNANGDLMFAAVTLPFDISDRFSVTGNLFYADYDSNTAGGIVDAIEVSGVATYAMSESTSLTYKAGYLAPSYDDDTVDDPFFGHLLRMEVAF
jgi:endonuclease V-like protein UPF0215 family